MTANIENTKKIEPIPVEDKNQDKPGNRAYRRKTVAVERSRKPEPFLLSDDYTERKKMKALKVSNRIAKIKTKKIERLAEQKAEGIEPIKKVKTTLAERRQIEKRAKRIKFFNKIKKIFK